MHANGDPATNLWMADLIGRGRQLQISGGLSEGATARGQLSFNQNAGGNLVYEYPVQPAEFTTLATVGPDHNFEVESIIFQGGRSWLPDGKRARNFIRHTFSQQQ